MEYSILKEAKPEQTVNRIKALLSDMGIKLSEEIISSEYQKLYTPSSLKVFLHFNKECSTNGKGSCFINAKASAYAEFMERLQSQFLIPFNNSQYIYSPDEKIIDENILSENLINKYIKDKELLLNMNLLANSIVDDDLSNNHKSVLVPFYSYKDNNVINLPIFIISLIQGSTGISAGNTIEEALVQGLSEICERFAQTKIINENLSIPNIPQEKYMKYKKIKGMIKIFEEYDYSVLVKDASLEKDIPVICTVISDKKSQTVSIKFGAHPSLPIAIERCLTEFAQGQDITSLNRKIPFETFVSEQGLLYTIEENNLNFLNEKIQKCNIFIEDCDYIQNQFFERKPDFAQSNNAWIENETNINNKQLLKFLLGNIKKITDEIYIRDVSFLGFPSVIISIPEMSFVTGKNKELVKYRIELQKYIDEGMPENDFSVDFLFKAIKAQGPPIFCRNFKTSYKLPNENLLLMCAILLQDYSAIKKYSECLIYNKKSYEVYKKEFISNIILINKFYEMKSKNIDDELIFNYLYNNYSKDDVERFKLYKKYLSFEKIKNIILNDNSSSNNEINSLGNKEKYNELVQRLITVQEENVIDQQQLSKVFAI